MPPLAFETANSTTATYLPKVISITAATITSSRSDALCKAAHVLPNGMMLQQVVHSHRSKLRLVQIIKEWMVQSRFS